MRKALDDHSHVELARAAIGFEGASLLARELSLLFRCARPPSDGAAMAHADLELLAGAAEVPEFADEVVDAHLLSVFMN